MTAPRRSLIQLAEAMSVRDRQIIETVERFRFVSGKQMERLFFAAPGDEPATRARLARRALERLTDLGCLGRLDRRIGGVRAGSSGYVYAVGPSGRRLVSYWRGQGSGRGRLPHEPGSSFVRHILGVGETYVRMVEAERTGHLEVITFEPEPGCWRSFTSPIGGRLDVKPDAFARVGVGAFEDRYFVEIDCGTEGRGTITRKLRTYLDYYRSGSEQAAAGVFPKVLFITTTEARRALIVDVCAALPADAWQLFAVTTPAMAMDLICGHIEQGATHPRTGGRP